MSGQPIDMQQRFQPLERQFDLPPQAIRREHLLGGIVVGRQGRGQHHELCRDQTARIDGVLLAWRCAQHVLAGGLGRLRRLAQQDQAQRQRRLVAAGPGVHEGRVSTSFCRHIAKSWMVGLRRP
jgi:hypothetical protein